MRVTQPEKAVSGFDPRLSAEIHSVAWRRWARYGRAEPGWARHGAVRQGRVWQGKESRMKGKELLRRISLFIIRIALSLFAAWLVSIPVIPLAAQERGYTGAYGGEWLLIIAVFIAAYYFTSKILR